MIRPVDRGPRRTARSHLWVGVAVSISLFASLGSAGAVPFWTQTSGPGVASANVVFTSAGNVFLGTVGEGVFRSTNSGTSWSPANAGITDATVQAFTASPGFLFAGLQFDNAVSGGVVRSSDGGATWLQTSSDLAGRTVYSLLATGGAVYAGDGIDGVYKSTDDGANWTLANDGMGSNSINGLAVNGGTLFAVAGQGMFRSTNGADSWTPVPDMEFRSFFSIASAGSIIVAGGFQSVALSTNGGSSWKFVDVPLPSFSRIASLAIDGTTIYAGTAGFPFGVYKSTDSGAHWAPSNDSIEIVSVTGITLSSGRVVLAAGEKGVIVSTDFGGSWTQHNSGIAPGGNIRSLLSDGNTILAGTGGNGVHRTLDHGATWTRLGASNDGNLENEIVAGLAVQGSNAYASTLLGDGVYRSTNGGSNWQKVNTGFLSPFLQVFDVEISGSNVIAGADDGIYVSTNGGVQWTRTNDIGMSAALAKGTSFVFAIVQSGFFFDSGIYRSSNDGASWTMALQLGGGTPTSMSAQGHSVYVGDLLSGMIRSTNDGVSWSDVSPEPGKGVFSVLARPADVFAGLESSSDRAYRSTNQGSSWTVISQGLPINESVDALAANSTYAFAGTGFSGVWRWALAGATDVEIVDALDAPGPLLDQNVANPFRTTTRIAFRMPRSGSVRLTVHDLAGREVRRLVDGSLARGRYEETFDATGMATGVYWARLKTERGVESRKMIHIQ